MSETKQSPLEEQWVRSVSTRRQQQALGLSRGQKVSGGFGELEWKVIEK